jgi:hypothetical protein
VAVEDGWVIGFVSAVHFVHPDKPYPELWTNTIGAAGTHRGSGWERSPPAIFAVARELDRAEAWVLTDRANAAAMRNYAAASLRR